MPPLVHIVWPCEPKNYVENRGYNAFTKDPELSQKGFEDARWLGQRCEPMHPRLRGLFTSPSKRCIETARYAFFGKGKFVHGPPAANWQDMLVIRPDPSLLESLEYIPNRPPIGEKIKAEWGAAMNGKLLAGSPWMDPQRAWQYGSSRLAHETRAANARRTQRSWCKNAIKAEKRGDPEIVVIGHPVTNFYLTAPEPRATLQKDFKPPPHGSIQTYAFVNPEHEDKDDDFCPLVKVPHEMLIKINPAYDWNKDSGSGAGRPKGVIADLPPKRDSDSPPKDSVPPTGGGSRTSKGGPKGSAPTNPFYHPFGGHPGYPPFVPPPPAAPAAPGGSAPPNPFADPLGPNLWAAPFGQVPPDAPAAPAAPGGSAPPDAPAAPAAPAAPGGSAPLNPLAAPFSLNPLAASFGPASPAASESTSIGAMSASAVTNPGDAMDLDLPEPHNKPPITLPNPGYQPPDPSYVPPKSVRDNIRQLALWPDPTKIVIVRSRFLAPRSKKPKNGEGEGGEDVEMEDEEEDEAEKARRQQPLRDMQRRARDIIRFWFKNGYSDQFDPIIVAQAHALCPPKYQPAPVPFDRVPGMLFLLGPPTWENCLDFEQYPNWFSDPARASAYINLHWNKGNRWTGWNANVGPRDPNLLDPFNPYPTSMF